MRVFLSAIAISCLLIAGCGGGSAPVATPKTLPGVYRIASVERVPCPIAGVCGSSDRVEFDVFARGLWTRYDSAGVVQAQGTYTDRIEGGKSLSLAFIGPPQEKRNMTAEFTERGFYIFGGLYELGRAVFVELERVE
jgi:hypothetical protein